MDVESFLIVKVNKWIIHYDTKIIEIEGDGYKILEDNCIGFNGVVANTIQYGKKKILNFTGKYSIFQTENFKIDLMNQVISFYVKFEGNIICHFIFDHYDPDSLVALHTVFSEYKRSREK